MISRQRLSTGNHAFNDVQQKSRTAHTISSSEATTGSLDDSIGTVTAGNGNRSAIHYYFFTDHDPFKDANYYRFKQVDLDGRHIHSAVARMVFDHAGFSYMLLSYPLRDKLIISLQSGRNGALQVTIRDVAGNLLIRERQQLTHGSSNCTIPIKDVAAGTYIITITDGETTVTRKFVRL